MILNKKRFPSESGINTLCYKKTVYSFKYLLAVDTFLKNNYMVLFLTGIKT